MRENLWFVKPKDFFVQIKLRGGGKGTKPRRG